MTEKTSTGKSKRLKILEQAEIKAIYRLPDFTLEERRQYFTLSPTEKGIMKQLHFTKARIHYILQLGYFKARYQFYTFTLDDVAEDAQYVQSIHFPSASLSDLEITKVTRLKHQQMIMDLFGYRYCQAVERRGLWEKARQVVKIDSIKIDSKPIYIFRELMRYLARQKIIAPGYTVMQEMIGSILQREQERVIEIINGRLNDRNINSLNKLLSNPQGLYEITQLKREPKDFSIREIGKEIDRGYQIKELYDVAKELLPQLNISNESIKYYASLVNYYSVYQLHQLDKQLVFLYLLCFAYHRYRKLHDNLIACFIFQVREYVDEAKVVAKDRIYEYRLEQNHNLYKAGQVLKLFTDDTITGQTPFADVQTHAFSILERQQLESVAGYITKNARFDEKSFQWEHVDKMANRFKRRLRPILRMIDFVGTSANTPLLTAISFLKDAFARQRSLKQHDPENRPLGFISKGDKRYLYGKDEDGSECLLVDRYEFLAYRHLRNNLESGDIFCWESVRFRSLEDDLIDDELWKKKDDLIAHTGLSILKQTAEEHLDELKKLLEERLATVNQRILSGENEHIKIKKHGNQVRWSLPYPSVDESINHSFFNNLKEIDIQAILHFADQRCRFMSAFTHVLHRYTKQEADNRIIAACLLAWGTNMGLGRMGAISDINYQTLSTMSDNFLRLETLKKANDLVSNAIAHLPLFEHYNIDDMVHSSSDGQKFETAIHTFNARHSPKYFGLKKGIVSYTLLANHIPINAKIIGANESESHYVFDLLFNNTTEVQPTIHSTDTHGSNQVNFGILHLFGYQFAPRYKDIYDKVNESLYGFKHPSQYNDA